MSTVIVTTPEEITAILRQIIPQAAPVLPDDILELERLKRKALLTAEDVEKLYGLNSGTLRNKRAQGGGPEYLQEVKGGPVFYEHKSIQSYLSKWRKKTYD